MTLLMLDLTHKCVLVVDGNRFVGKSNKGLILCDTIDDKRVIVYKSEYAAELSHLRNNMFELFACKTIVHKTV